MVPGTQWTYRELDTDGTELAVIVTVTDQTKEIANGITARVVRDTVMDDGELVEDTFDWYAQDDEGNVWYLGEDTAEFENGEIVSTEGSFEAGVDGALPGIVGASPPGTGDAVPPGVLRGPGRGCRRGAEHGRAGRGAIRDVQRRAPHS